MLKEISIKNELLKQKDKPKKAEDFLIDEVNRLLKSELINERNILNNLKFYNKTFELLNENEIDKNLIFTPTEIKKICIKYRLRFLDSQLYKAEIPYVSILKIKHLNEVQRKNLKGFKILSSSKSFLSKKKDTAILFAPTVNGNYYLIHHWGENFKWYRKYMAFPLQTFETLALFIATFTLIETLLLPTYLITLDRDATYWCGYRIATYFHILIFNSGVTAYFTFALNKNFSKSIWNNT